MLKNAYLLLGEILIMPELLFCFSAVAMHSYIFTFDDSQHLNRCIPVRKVTGVKDTYFSSFYRCNFTNYG